MAEHLAKYQVQAPEHHVGEVMGHLSRIGGWLDGHSEEGGRSTISVRLPVDVVPELEKWLAKTFGGAGRIVSGNQSDEDA